MDNRVAFLVWTLAGCLEIGDGIRCFFSKEPVGYFANRKRQIFHTFEVTDVQSYNRATGKLWCVFGILFILLGIPWLAGKGSARILIPICGVLPLEILAFAIYELGISRKYRKKQQEGTEKSSREVPERATTEAAEQPKIDKKQASKKKDTKSKTIKIKQ